MEASLTTSQSGGGGPPKRSWFDRQLDEADSPLRRWVLRRVRRRRWETVYGAVRFATAPQAAKGIDLAGLALSVRDFRRREVTVKSTGQGGAPRLWQAETAADRARVLKVIGELSELQQFVLIASAWGLSQRAVGQRLRDKLGTWDNDDTAVLLRYAIERAERRLVDLEYLPPWTGATGRG